MNAARTEAWLWILQRISAWVLAICVCAHLATMIYAVHKGLSAAAMIARMQTSVAFPAFYALFVIAASMHAPIGLRNIVAEHFSWRGRSADAAMLAFGIALTALGLRAIAGLTS